MIRKSRDQRFMDLCHTSKDDWSTCDRAHVGAIVARGGEPQGPLGYNGAPSKQPHCDDVGHLMDNGHCVRTVHAEDNALWLAGRERCQGATLYTTHFPCWNCALLIARAGIARLVFANDYGQDMRTLSFLLGVCRVERFVNGEARAVRLVEAVR